MKENYFVYIMSNKKGGVLYIGITSDIVKRVFEHKNEYVDGFTKKYNLKKLVYYELFYDPENAIKREKVLKKWNRNWKIKLIESENKEWKDLYDTIVC